MLDQRELAAGRDINFQRCAAVYIDGVGRDLAGTVPNGEATVGQLEETLRAILAAL